MAAVLVRTYAVFVQMPAMLVQKNAKNMQKWAWIIAVNVQKLVVTVLRLVKKWLLRYKGQQ
ncbi:hypothetical protein J2Y45_006793 [Dyadobacter sp. BE34]|uniref:Uncharacterized protein n=1 Tax=Dyadobacter fermentans TaxID=94254 RepID=A0ABU1R8I4_9BACT|nr:hypothetical protein [Dyadobacter fermentans]MDR7047459.1 hypothetical protein [Dyadobacter sp. BE242]MDR7201629.1 hypothetical protein [Dyadobacter sp. BE34]MDR7219499.1 hypothetical protein [Dyadobacter sp. BE31]MDR7267266.1 hypothetical protein [Dyadobacter sp. BE32]